MTEIERIFKTNDLNTTEPLYQSKKDTIQSLEKKFTRDLNSKSRHSSGNDDFWKDGRFYMLPVHLQPVHLNYALENKKAFIKWFLNKFPKYNILYDSKKRNAHTFFKYGRKGTVKRAGIHPYYVARQRDLLFGTNGVEATTVDNWREKIRDAQTEQEIEDIKFLLDSRWEIDNFFDTVEILIEVINDDLWDLNWQVNGVEKTPEGEWYLNREKHKGYFEGEKKYFSQTFFGVSLRNVARHFYNQQFKERFVRGGSENAWGSAGTGSINSLVQLQQEAGMDFCNFVAFDLMFDELQRVKDKALFKAQECEKAHLWEKIWKLMPTYLRGGKGWVTPDTIVWSSSPTSPPEKNSKNPDESIMVELGQEQENKPSEPAVSNQDQEKQINNKLTEIKDNLKNQTVNKNETKSNLNDLKVELAKLEKSSDGSSDSKKTISSLAKQIEELKEQVRELKQSLKGMLEEVKDYALKLFNYFKKENIKQITFEEDGSAKVEYEDNKSSKTFSASEIDSNQELLTLKEYSRQSQQKSLSYQELSQVVESSSPNTNSKHWDKYGKYYIGAGITLILISTGALVYYLWVRTKEK